MSQALANLDANTFTAICQQLKVQNLDERGMQDMRRRYPDLRFLLCSEDDIPELVPFKRCETFDVHLMGAGLGCSKLTLDLNACAGLVIATHEA